MPVQVREASSAAERHDIFRLRYEIYVDELGRVQKCADHAARIIEEPLDRDAILLAAYEGARLVGSVRVNYASRGDLGDYESLYQMQSVGPAHPGNTCITTKMLVAADYRNSPLAYRLAVAAYKRALVDGILHDFIDVYPARQPFFERMGYRVHVPRAFHEEFGEVIVMSIHTRDAEHFRRVGSPFLRHLEQHMARPETPEERHDRVA